MFVILVTGLVLAICHLVKPTLLSTRSPTRLVQIELKLHVPCIVINVSTYFEMTSDARQKSGKARYLKHCKCA